ncbi:MAG TPA: NADH-quinone oxidoreductase subunit C [Bacteroidetes bacterium]|nr:NADH-quinone oxidoreductase subunit C [Bacteroidota bacterium]
MASNEEILKKVQEKFGDCVLEVKDALGEATISIKRDCNVEVLKFLRDDPDLAFEFLMDACGIDYLEMGGFERFAVVYHLYSLKHNHRVRVKAFIPENDPRIDTVSHLWAAANWAEREVFDMYGIEFNNHPDMRRILCPDDFVGHPLRKDFPLQGIGYRESFEKIERSTAQ